MLHPTKGFSGVPTAVLKRRWRKGVPRGWRRAAWPELMDHGPAEFKTAAGLRQITYQSLVNSPPSSYDEVIEKDVVRTFPRHARFATAVADGGRSAGGDDEAAAISSLRRILRAYAALDKECGYCQGMNYVAGLLLLACDSASRSPNDPSASSDAADDEERCFWLLVATARGPRTRLRDLYLPSMVGCRRALYAYDAFLRKLRPKLAAHLERENVQPAMYATHWFVTVFAAQFPAPFAARASVSVMRGGQGIWSYVRGVLPDPAGADSNAAHLSSKSAHFASDAADVVFAFARAARFRSFFAPRAASCSSRERRSSRASSSRASTLAQCSASARSRASLRRVSSADSAPWYPPPAPKRPRIGLCSSSTHLEPFHVAPGGPVRSGSTPSLAPGEPTSLAYPIRSSTRHPRACAHDAHSISDEPTKAQRAKNA